MEDGIGGGEVRGMFGREINDSKFRADHLTGQENEPNG
jgi:hypothetical protein